jgi:membrane-bound ClpP family serine protease
LIDEVGTAKTDLLPSGMVMIDGEKIDAVSIGMPIDAGTKVVVTSVDAGRVHVRAASKDDVSEEHPAAPQSPASLEKSIDSFDVE